MTIFRTQSGSVYELGDHAIRRLEGKNDPTPRQGKDGEWREFLGIGLLQVGYPFAIAWRLEDGVLKSTITSVVTTIEEVPS